MAGQACKYLLTLKNKAKGTFPWARMEISNPTHKSSSPDFIPKVHPQNSAKAQFWVQVLASRHTTWFKAKMPGLSGKTNATKNLSKSSPSPSPLLLTTRSAELKLSALKNSPKIIVFVLGNISGKDNQDLWEELEETPIEVDEFDSLFSRPQVKSFFSFKGKFSIWCFVFKAASVKHRLLGINLMSLLLTLYQSTLFLNN